MKLLNLMVDSGTKLVMGISAIAELVVTFAQVLFRYVLKSPLPWSQDVLRLAFTYLVFWGAAWCVREKGHLNVDVVLTAIPVRLRAAVELVINLVLCAFFLFLVVYGSIPSAALLMLFYMVQIVAEQVLSLFHKEDRA